MTSLVGLHGRTNGRLTQADLDCVRIGKIEAAKLLSTAAYTDVDSLRAINPSIFILVRLFADFSNRVISPELFVSSIIDDLNGFYAKGIRHFEIHNEPNLTLEGLRSSWSDGVSFAAWWASVRNYLRAIHPGLLLGWPGISPGPQSDIRMDENKFLDGAGPVPSKADWIGVHCYWQQPAQVFDRQGGGNYLNYQDRYPGKEIYITEFAMTDPSVASPIKGNSYVKYYQGLVGIKAAFSFVSSSPSDGQGHLTYAGQTWANEDRSLTEIPGIVGARSNVTEFAGIEKHTKSAISSDKSILDLL